MADQKEGEGVTPEKPENAGPEKRPLQEDRILARLVGGSTSGSTGITTFVGLLGRSPKEGYWLLYLGLDMSVYVEIREDDIIHSEQLPPDKSPFGSLGGTRIYVKKDAEVITTRTVSRTHKAGAAEDEFDLDIRLGGSAGPVLQAPCRGTEFGTTCGADCPGPTGDGQTCLTCRSCGDTCFRTCADTCRTQCDTCPGDTCARTCDTCRRTQCGQTCQTCQTCQTQCGTCQTCQTCQTQCGTCQTCRTQCGTCQTCQTCQTCRTQCDTCPGDTCRACTHVTCFRTCDVC